MADDIAALIKHLGLETADIFGYSMGGGVALQVGIRHADVVRKLVIASAPCKRDGWYPEVLAGAAATDAKAAEGTPIHQAYIDAAPRPDDWPVIVEKTKALLVEDYDWSAEVGAIKAPTLIVIGDSDGVRLPHAAEMFGLLGGGKPIGWVEGGTPSQLAVLPGTLHFTIMERTDLLLPAVSPFLDAMEGK